MTNEETIRVCTPWAPLHSHEDWQRMESELATLRARLATVEAALTELLDPPWNEQSVDIRRRARAALAGDAQKETT